MPGPSTSQPIGTMGKSNTTPVRIVQVESIDLRTGAPFKPPEYEFWVVTLESPPRVLEAMNSLQEAMNWVKSHPKYHLVGEPPNGPL